MKEGSWHQRGCEKWGSAEVLRVPTRYSMEKLTLGNCPDKGKQRAKQEVQRAWLQKEASALSCVPCPTLRSPNQGSKGGRRGEEEQGE